MQAAERVSFRAGVRLGLPFSMVAFLLASSFGVLAAETGFSPLQAVTMSAVLHSGAAQFAGTAIIAVGGGVVSAVLAASLMNARYLAMGVALAPSLPGGPVSRALQGQTVVDPSWVVANNGDGTFDRWLLFGASTPQYVAWVTGTLAGVLSGDLIGDTETLGLDAIYPTFFLALLISELRRPGSRGVALGGAAIALALVPFVPPGVPILVAASAALIGLKR